VVDVALATIGIPVTVDRMEVRTGKLLHADQHELSRYPRRLWPKSRLWLGKLQRSEQGAIEFYRSKNFSVESSSHG